MANILYENGFPIKAIVNGKMVDVQEVKHGHWEPISRGEVGYSAGDFRCTVCGTPNKCYSLTPFCPNCGASMRSIDDEVADLPMEAYYNKDWKMDEVEE